MSQTAETLMFEKCAKCQHGQKLAGRRRLCDYGTQAIPTESMRHPLGLCGGEASLFVPIQKRYAEFDE